ncbi:hypothetical protein Q3G72_012171 [Acer saccharum]|nr:hypothetical protein Q3G72_012171 [Acer saccharum]
MSWSRNQRDSEWLKKCAVGVLKVFSNVSFVNSKLSTRGFSFSSVFLGEKCVLWFFDMVVERDGFIRNKFFWEDCFVSMQSWTDSFLPKFRLAWVNCTGVLLSCWCPALFMKLGWMIDEPLMVDEEISRNKRLDRGRLLIIVNQDQTISAKVLVKTDQGSFNVHIKEEGDKVDWAGIDNFLELQKAVFHDLNLHEFPGGGSTGAEGKKEGGLSYSIGSREKSDQTGKGLDIRKGHHEDWALVDGPIWQAKKSIADGPGNIQYTMEFRGKEQSLDEDRRSSSNPSPSSVEVREQSEGGSTMQEQSQDMLSLKKRSVVKKKGGKTKLKENSKPEGRDPKLKAVRDGWSLADEIKRVIDTGIALGFDYNSNIEEVIEVITAREVEDVDRSKVKYT